MTLATGTRRSTDDLYFIQSEYGGPIKIGRTQDVRFRLATLQTGHPEPLQVIGIIRSGGRFEGTIHAHYERFRLRGEWFEDAPSILRFIERMTR